MGNICSIIVEGSRRYQVSMEGLVWDRVLEAAPVLQSYILYGLGPRGFDDSAAAKLLWAWLAVWGNVKSLHAHREDLRDCALGPWVARYGRSLIAKLRNEYRAVLERLAFLPEAPHPGDIEEVRGQLEELYQTLLDVRCLGATAASKIIALLTLFHIPPVDSAIAECISGKRELSKPSDYVNAVKKLAEMLARCMESKEFREYLAERRARAHSIIEAKPFKILDEGLWFTLVYDKRTDICSANS